MNRHTWRHSAIWGLAALALTTGGCSFFPESMQPINLQKWNRGPGPATDPFYSIQDSTPLQFAVENVEPSIESAAEAAAVSNCQEVGP